MTDCLLASEALRDSGLMLHEFWVLHINLLVLFALLNSHMILLEVLVRGKALRDLCLQFPCRRTCVFATSSWDRRSVIKHLAFFQIQIIIVLIYIFIFTFNDTEHTIWREMGRGNKIRTIWLAQCFPPSDIKV